ncbi:MAG: S9 family peptidase [Candidatus Eremiobacteraeota bacterium]|nr:S9 family peptidase [Candidatus Eremiobacteraeota bacterium]
MVCAPEKIKAHADTPPKLIPRKVLFGNPEKASPRISPDGKMLAYIAPYKGVLNVWVKTVGKEDDRVVTGDKDRGIRRYFWGFDKRHILYLQDVGGNENWSLYGVDLLTGKARDYTPYKNVVVNVVGRDKDFPEELLVTMNKENPKVFDVYLLNLKTGKFTLVAKNPGNIIGWMRDANFKILGALASTKEGGFNLLVRKDEHSKWKTLVEWDADDSLTSGPIAFTGDGKYFYLKDSRNRNTARLVKMDISTGKIVKVLAEDPVYDVNSVMINPDTRKVEAVLFLRARGEWVVLDDSLKPDFEAIRKLDHGDFTIYNRDNADNTWLIGFRKDTGPTSYYAFDRKKKKGRFLFVTQPELKKYTLAPMEPISFKSRDGLTIHGYITFPPEKEKKNLPMVLYVHGGPWGRDYWCLDPVAQWLANRGYICLQVNFRGSTGYGKAFLNAGDREWGGKMHNDLVDAVKWAVKKGYADPKKVAIFGGSYGGYSALVGATFTPDLFCCAVDLVGPSNLITFIKTVPPYWSAFLKILHKRVGNPDTDEEFLKSRSPLFKVDQIKIPMLIAQGANDPRVKQAESEQIVEAMKKKGIQYEYMLFPDEGHGLAKPVNRLKFFSVMEKFLAKHLGGRYEK